MGARVHTRHPWGDAAVLLAGLLLLTLTVCSDSDRKESADRPKSDPPVESVASPASRPNVLWVVWDTVRADRMSLYGHSKPTTPLLEEWAKGARVYDDCTSTASSTTPSHAAMFTGLLPSEHRANNQHSHLDDELTTVAERFQQTGYQTYLFSANPHISSTENFQQGFDVTEHPWDPQYFSEALEIVRGKISERDRSSDLPQKLRDAKSKPWNIKACGELTQRAALDWLGRRGSTQPFFMFLNYMEAHRPFIPEEKYRRRVMTPQQVDRSYEIDRSWIPMWSYCFRMREYSSEELEVMAATYDATLAELDELFHNLLGALEAAGHLEDTIIVLTSDHGEHLGEHHLLDHQYTLYNPVLRMPLVVHYPKRFSPGRDGRPVVNFDLFPTLLELAGIDPPAGWTSRAVSLLSAPETRSRVAEYPAALAPPFNAVQMQYPDFNPRPWQRTLRALLSGDYKYIWASDGNHELYNVRQDPAELQNLAGRSAQAERLAAELEAIVKTMNRPAGAAQPTRPLSREELERLAALGYVDLPSASSNAADPADDSDEQ
ncbi:MAG: sulfatase [bacterium]|nr:sulfatase [bacterium]